MSKDLSSHLSTLLEARSVSQQELDPLVAYAIQETRDDRSLDTRRAQYMCDNSFPFSVLEDLLEGQTIESSWHIFSWIEEHTERLTTNMIPAKGKSLVLLRTLNDLLRRLSKTGKNTIAHF
ncbi:hypothetical protein BU17DRAFT_86383 [Hysterangium stoloniferum]|nr:hypothetical protein BU17DRAFT_86383 [Hysterangium stoloniferum]